MGGPLLDPDDLPTPDRLRAMLRTTEGRLANARRVQEDRELRLGALSRADRRTREGSRLAGLVETGRTTIQALESMLAGVRYELGEGEMPEHCFAERHGLRCELPWGHVGMHAARAHSGLRTRWEA